jgi:hypothetical protein
MVAYCGYYNHKYMTQEEIELFVYRLSCCSGTMGETLAKKLALGNNCSINTLMILNDYIDVLLKYDLTSDTNCIDGITDGFDDMVAHARSICDICDCTE